MKKKYVLNFFQFFFVWFSPVFGVFLILAIYLTTITFQTILQLISFKGFPDNFDLVLISLVPLWYLVHIVWKEFRFPVVWLSNNGITALAIAIIPIKVYVPWVNILNIKETRTLEGTLFDCGTSVLIKPSGKMQKRVFKLSGGNEIFISSKMTKYDELVNLITENIK